MKKIISTFLLIAMFSMLIPTRTFAATITSNQTETAINWATNQMNSGNKSYINWCLAFVSDAFKAAGVTAGGYDYATLAGNAMVKHTDLNPPRGAVVFYNWSGTIKYNGSNTYNNWGHVAISLGNGKVIHADYDRIKVTDIIIPYRQYRGWGVWGNNELGSATSTPTNNPIVDGIYTIESRQGGNLNIYAGRNQDGTKACIWQKDNSKEQHFRIVSVGYSKYKIYVLSSNNGYGRVLDANRGTSYSSPLKYGLNIDIWRTNDAPAQEWYITNLNNGFFKIELAALKDGVVESAGSRNNSNVSLQKYNGSNAQQWKFVK